MKLHTNNFKNQIKLAGRELDVKITYKIDENQVILTSEDINNITPSFHGSILKSVMKELEFDSNIDIPMDTIIHFEFGIKVNGSYEYLDFGNYVVYLSEKQEDTYSYKISCYDKMLYTMKINESLGVTYPITIREYLKALCNKIGFAFANSNDEFTNYDKVIEKELYFGLDYTYRDIFDELAQVTASTICLNNNDEIEIRYINDTNDIIDEEYLKDINVKFGQKYGPINSIVLSRSAESDNVFLQDEESISSNGLCEIKIIDNQIMNWNDRSDYLPKILERLNGLEYYINDFTSTGVCYYDLCDKYNVKIGETLYPCIMFNDEIEIDAGIVENVYNDMPSENVTDYSKADKTDRRINQVYIIADKQGKQIEALVSETTETKKNLNNLSTPILTKQGNNHICIEDALEESAIEYTIEGKCEQEKREYKNIIDNNNYSIINGFATINTPTITSNNNFRSLYTECKPNTTYIIEKIKSTRFSISYTTELPIVGMQANGIIQNNENIKETYTTGENANYLVILYYSNSTDTLSEEEIRSSIKVYQPVLPSVDYPSEIKTIKGINNLDENHQGNWLKFKLSNLEDNTNEQYEEQEVLVEFNKPNLFDKNNANILKAFMRASTKQIIQNNPSRTLYIECKPNTTYTLKKVVSENFAVAESIEEPDYNRLVDNWVSNKTSASIMYTTSSKGNYLLLQYMDNSNTIDEQVLLDSIRIYEGYDPYYELCSIGETKDTLEVVSGNLEKRIGKMILNGSANWTKSSSNICDRYFTTIFNERANVSKLNALSNLFKFIKSTGETKNIGCFFFGTYNETTRLFIDFAEYNTSDLNGFKAVLNEKVMNMYYELEEAEILQLPIADIPLFKNENHIELLEDIETNTSIKYYRLNKLNEAYYTKAENDAQLKITSNKIENTISSTKTELKNDLNDINNNLNNNFYQKKQVEQLVLDSSNGLTNTFSEAGGNNILRNTNFSAKEVLEEGQIYEYWYGNTIRNVNGSSANGYSILLQNNSFYQEQSLANGNYTLSFYYKKTNPLANVFVKINDNQYELDSTDFSLFQTGIKDENDSYIIDPITITDNRIKVEFICDINNACEVYDIMLNAGKVKLAYSQNQNETITDSVNIGRGISIKSSASETEFVATNENIGFKNNSGNFTTEFNSKGMSTNEAVIKNEAEIVGILRQRVGDQIWDCMI